MRVFITGASSFTGCCIARAFVEKGHQVCGALTQELEEYTGLVRDRINFSKVGMFYEKVPFGSDDFIQSLKNFRPQVFINHGADIKGYRSPNFNIYRSVFTSTLNLDSVLDTLKEFNCGVVHSGTYFEKEEGGSPLSLGMYGYSKSIVWEKMLKGCKERSIFISKVVIPNPIGKFENEDRLIPTFVRQWKNKETPTLTTPDSVQDNVPVEWLAQVYLKAAIEPRVYRPSGFILSNEELVSKVSSCKVNLVHDKPAIIRYNNEPVEELKSPQRVQEFWDSFSYSAE